MGTQASLCLNDLVSHKNAIKQVVAATGDLGFDYFALRQQVRAGKIETARLPDGNTAVVRKSLERFLAERSGQ